MASIGELTARLGLDTAEFRHNADLAEARIRDLGSSMRAGVNQAVKYGTAIAAAGTAIGIAYIDNALDAGRELQNLARISGTTTKEFQRQAYAARTVGIESDKLGDIYKDTQDKVGDFLANSGGELQDFFDNIAPQVGVTADAFRNLSGPEALQLFAQTLDDANISQSEMVNYMESIGDEASALIPLLKDNAEGMRELGDEAESAGLLLSDFDIQALEDARHTVDQLTGTMSALGTTIVADLAPYIEVIGKEFLSSRDAAGDFTDDTVRYLGSAVSAVGKVADVAHGVRVSFLLALGSAQAFGTGVVTGANAVVQAWTYAVNAINDGALAIADAYNAIPGLPDMDTSGLEQNAINYANRLDWLKDKNAEMEVSTQQTWRSIQDALAEPMPSDGIEDWWDNVQSKVAALRNETSDSIASVGGSLPDGGFNPAGSQQAGSGQPSESNEERAKRQQQGDYYRAITDQFGRRDPGVEQQQREQQQNQQQFDQIRGQLQSPEEREDEQHQKRMEFLQKAADGRIQIDGNANEQIEKEAERHRDAMADIAKDQGATILNEQQGFLNNLSQAYKTTGSVMYQNLAQAFTDITSVGARENKALFEINKAAGIANALISTYEGANKALSSMPFPANIAAAAAVTASGLARVSAIESQQFGGGGAGGGAAAPSTAASTSAPAVEDVSQRQGGEQQPGQSVFIDARGRPENEREFIRRIAEGLNDFTDDGGRVGRVEVSS